MIFERCQRCGAKYSISPPEPHQLQVAFAKLEDELRAHIRDLAEALSAAVAETEALRKQLETYGTL